MTKPLSRGLAVSGLLGIALIGRLPAQGHSDPRPTSRLEIALGASSRGASLGCSSCGDVDLGVDRSTGMAFSLGVHRPLSGRLGLRFNGNIGKFTGEYLGTVTLGFQYLVLPASGLFVHAGLGAYHQTSSNDCLTILEPNESGDSGCGGWEPEAAGAVALGVGMNVPVEGRLAPVVRLDWQRTILNGFGSSDFPFHYNQVTLSLGLSLGL